jgi:hypothetical protein
MKLITWSIIAVWATMPCACTPDSAQPAPVGFTFETAEGTFASFGWTGFFHNRAAAVGTPFGVKTTSCDERGVCRFEGPSDLVRDVHRQRCLFKTSKECTTDGDCGELAPCVYIYDPPVSNALAGADGNAGACGFSYIPLTSGEGPTITGTLNLTSGALNIENIAIRLPLNAKRGADDQARRGFHGVCRECVGDPTANDGKKEGLCVESARRPTANTVADKGPSDEAENQPCDVNRYGTLAGYDGNYSMDCSPTLERNTGNPIELGGSLTTSGFQIGITSASPDCTTGIAGQKCFCAMCDDGVTPCRSDAQCGMGTCGGGTQVVGRDSCDGACRWDAETNTGSCPLKGMPTVSIPCYPSGLGASIVAGGRRRRDDSITTTYYAETATAGCMAPATGTDASITNAQVGLPGLLFQQRNFRIIPQYEEEGAR